MGENNYWQEVERGINEKFVKWIDEFKISEGNATKENFLLWAVDFLLQIERNRMAEKEAFDAMIDKAVHEMTFDRSQAT